MKQKMNVKYLFGILFLFAILLNIVIDITPKDYLNSTQNDTLTNLRPYNVTIKINTSYFNSITKFNNTLICPRGNIEEEVQCDCAKNTTHPCMAYCFKCYNVSNVSNVIVSPSYLLSQNITAIIPTNTSIPLNWSKLKYDGRQVIWVMQKEVKVNNFTNKIIACIEIEHGVIFCEK